MAPAPTTTHAKLSFRICQDINNKISNTEGLFKQSRRTSGQTPSKLLALVIASRTQRIQSVHTCSSQESLLALPKCGNLSRCCQSYSPITNNSWHRAIKRGNSQLLTRVTVLVTKAPSKEATLSFGDTHGSYSSSHLDRREGSIILKLKDPALT